MYLDTKLLFNEHIDRTTAKARSTLGLVKRFSKELQNQQTERVLYVSLVRPILEYATPVWGSRGATRSARIESVQKQYLLWALRHTHPVDVYPRPPYHVRLEEHRIDSLQNRRSMFSAMLAFDSLEGSIDSEWLNSRLTINNPTRTTRRPQFFRIEQHRTDYAQHSPSESAKRTFNETSHLYSHGMRRDAFKKAVLGHFRSSTH